MPRKSSPMDFTEEETRLRVEAAIRGARLVGHKSQDEMKIGKPRGKPGKSPGKRKAMKKSGR